MKIKNIKINSYGKLENKEINFSDELNIIYGKNESGKSTLLNFIINMFYGISKNKNGKEFSEYEKYKPWKEKEFSGKIKYELDNEKTFEVFRDFNKKNAKVYNGNLDEVSEEFNIDKKDGNQFFYEQCKMDRDTFLSTLVTMQQEVRLGKQQQNTLVQKIANLAGTGDDKVSYKKAIDRLSKKQIEEVGSDRTQGRPINLVRNRMKELTVVLEEIKTYQEEKFEIEKKKQILVEEIQDQMTKNEVLEKIQKIKNEAKIEKEKNKINKKTIEENNKKIEQFSQEKNNFQNNKKIIMEKIENKIKENNIKKYSEKNKKINSKKYIIIFIVLLLINLIQIIFIKNNLIAILLVTLIPILFFIYYFRKNKFKKINQKIEEKYNQKTQEEIGQLQEKENEIENQLIKIKSQIELLEKNNIELNQTIQETENKNNNSIEKRIQELKEQNLFLLELNLKEEIEDILQNEKNKLENQKLEFHRLELEEKNILPKLEDMVNKKEELEMLEEQYHELQEKNETIEMTKQFLEIAYEKMKNNITPKFAKNLSQTVEKISNGKYQKITIHDENGMIVELQNGEYVPIDKLSIGTIDQLYLSLRLSMIQELSDETMPIILDEAFAYYDDERLENILKYLIKELKGHQIILFTCTNRERKILEKLQVSFCNIEI